MSQRLIRLNSQLIQTLSEILHTKYQSQSTTISLTAMDLSPDLKQAKVFYSVIGSEAQKKEASSFLSKIRGLLRTELAKRIAIQYIPKLSFIYDKGIAHGTNIIRILDQLENSTPPKH